jgi:hypothetical protein
MHSNFSVMAIQEQQRTIEDLQLQINELKSILRKLKI